MYANLTWPAKIPWLLIFRGFVWVGVNFLFLLSSLNDAGISSSSADEFSNSGSSLSSTSSSLSSCKSCFSSAFFLDLVCLLFASSGLKCFGDDVLRIFEYPLAINGNVGDSVFSFSSGDSQRPLIFNWSAVLSNDWKKKHHSYWKKLS